MPVYEINWRPSANYLRLFATMLLLLSGLAAAWLHWRLNATAPAAILLVAGALVSLVGWVSPATVRPVYLVWMTLALPFGWLLSHAMMIGLYYLVVTPMAMALRWIGHDPMRRQFPGQDTSYWEPRPDARDVGQYFKQY